MFRHNYYLLLDLDDNIDDYDQIQRVIKEKRMAWSKLTKHPKKGNDFQAKLDALRGVDDVMSDPELRRQEANEAKKLKREAKEKEERKRFAKLDSSIAIIAKKGWIEDEEINVMVKSFNLSKDAVLERMTIPIEKHLSKPKESKVDKTSVSQAKKIADTCLKLGIKTKHKSNVASLYDYLNLAPTTSTNKILEESDKRYKVIANKGKNAINNLERELQALCKTIFESNRSKYDQALSDLRLKQLDDYLKIATATEILPQTVKNELIREAMILGDIGEIAAKDYIDTYCLENKIKMDDGNKTVTPTLHLRKCGSCGRVHDEFNHYCKNCSNVLVVECPMCNHKADSSDLACGQCGFSVGNLANVNKILMKAKRYIYLEKYDQANICISEVLTLWPNHPDALKSQKEIRMVEQENTEKILKIKNLVEKKYYYKARSLIMMERKLVQTSTSLQSLEKECLERIHQSESFLKRARITQEKEMAMDYYFKAYETSADCKEAEQMLVKSPPALPTGLQVNSSSNSISLRWQPSPSKGTISYRLLRKKDGPSLHSNDGDILQESSECFYVDYKAKGGYNYYYSIYTIRGTVVSRDSLNKGPFIRWAEVEEIEINQENNSIYLAWKKPGSASAVEVWRKEKEVPTKRGDGELIQTVTGVHYIDNDVVYGRSYGYRLVVVYENEQTFYSEGETLQSKAVRTPKAYLNLDTVRSEDGIKIVWKDTIDTLDIYYSYSPFQVKTGKSVPLEELSAFENKVTKNKDNQAFISVNKNKTVYILPVTKNEELAVFGQMKVSKEHPEVKNIRHRLSDDSLTLQWDWPKDISKAIVVYREDTFPLEPNDPEATQNSIDKSSYDVLNGYVINAEEQNYYFTIFTEYEENGNLIHSNGSNYLCMNSDPIDLTYSIKVSGLFSKKISLVLSSKVPVILPDLVLVKKEGAIPTRKEQGNIIRRIQSQMLKNELEIEIPNEHLEQNTYGKLFFDNEQNAPSIRLQAENGKKAMELW